MLIDCLFVSVWRVHASFSFSLSTHVFLALIDGWMDCDCLAQCVTVFLDCLIE